MGTAEHPEAVVLPEIISQRGREVAGDVETTAYTNCVMTGYVRTGSRSTLFEIGEPRRADATPDQTSAGEHLLYTQNHTRLHFNVDHSTNAAPDAETAKGVLSCLGAAMLVLKQGTDN